MPVSIVNSITFLGESILAAPLAAGTAIFTLMVAFSYLIFHQTTYKEETGFLKGQKIMVSELEAVESSQERRSKKEREEEQALSEESEDENRPPAKRQRLEEPTVAELVEHQLSEYDQRTHLVTFAATDAEADFIFKYVPKARYLISLDAEEHHDHITEVRYARLRSFSAPADIA